MATFVFHSFIMGKVEIVNIFSLSGDILENIFAKMFIK